MPPTTTTLNEYDVLRPRDRKLTNEDDWEDFSLSAALVHDPVTGLPTSLLHADATSPVTVTGRLDALPREKSHLLLASAPKTGGLTITIPNVTRFAYGQYDDGEVAIWAAGAAGWFNLAPARPYKALYADMVAAITTLYALADAYRADAAPTNRSARAVFKSLAREQPQRFGTTADKAAEAVYKHREFLLLSMLRGKELEGGERAWAYTDVFLHMKGRFPETWRAVEAKNAGKVVARAPSGVGEERGKAKEKRGRGRPLGSRTGGSEAEVETEVEEVAVEKVEKEGKAKKKQKKVERPPAKAGAPPRKDDNWWETKVVWEMMQKVQIQGLVAPGSMTVEAFAKVMVRKYEVDDEGLAAEYIMAHASNLVYMMAHKRRPAVDWTEQPVYTELSQARLSARALQRTSELPIRRRRDPLPYPEPEPEAQPEQDEEDSPSDVVTPVEAPRRRKARHSILAPKGGKYSGKGMTRSGKSYHRSSGDEDDDTDTPEVMSLPKRKSETEDGNNRRKRQQSSQGVSTSDSEDDRKETLPLRWKTPQSQRATPLSVPTLLSEPPLSIEANSPGDIWRCIHDGCVHKVYGASLDESQVLIAEHLDEHDAKRKEAVELARSEELRSHLPVR